jgi:hypothetical protein
MLTSPRFASHATFGPHTRSIAGSKVFVIDTGVDGLAVRPGDGPDSCEQGPKSVLFAGEWRKAKLSEEDYRKTLAEADERYTKMLSLLAAQATGVSAQAPGNHTVGSSATHPRRAHYVSNPRM